MVASRPCSEPYTGAGQHRVPGQPRTNGDRWTWPSRSRAPTFGIRRGPGVAAGASMSAVEDALLHERGVLFDELDHILAEGRCRGAGGDGQRGLAERVLA